MALLRSYLKALKDLKALNPTVPTLLDLEETSTVNLPGLDKEVLLELHSLEVELELVLESQLTVATTARK